MLCDERFKKDPAAVGRMTPFQVRAVFLCERDKDGQPALDPPLGEPPLEIPMAREWRDTLTARGWSDPDAIRRATPGD